jgi:iron(III) transport system ATP-binding protein
MLRLQELYKRYQAQAGEPAGGVFGVSFEVKKGEMFTLLGPSGCGKTTTLRCIAGLEIPDTGAISLDGEVMFDGATDKIVPMYDRDIGMVFQSYAIWPHMSVFENAAYPLRVSRKVKYNRADIDKRVDRVLEMVGLLKFKNRSATQLSGGQQQRLALARALVREPKLLLLDEPLSNLDAQLREQMRTELKRIQAEWGVTTIYVTHDQSEAMAISDRIAVMDHGLMVQLGTPDEIYELPRSEFVANFIGRTNMFRGKCINVAEAGSMGVVDSEIGTVRCRFPAKLAAGEKVSFVVRPENIELSPVSAGKSGDNMVEGKVISRVYLGEIAEYSIDLDGKFQLLVRAAPGIGATTGDRIRAYLPPEKTIAIFS